MNNAISTTANGMTLTFSSKTDSRIVDATRRAGRVIVRCTDRAAAKALTSELRAWGVKGISQTPGLAGLMFMG